MSMFSIIGWLLMVITMYDIFSISHPPFDLYIYCVVIKIKPFIHFCFCLNSFYLLSSLSNMVACVLN